MEECLGIQAHLKQLRDTGILIKYQSPWNTSLLPVKKAGGNDNQSVQDLWAVNNAIITLHLNPTYGEPTGVSDKLQV
jgi:hypothetical protein